LAIILGTKAPHSPLQSSAFFPGAWLNRQHGIDDKRYLYFPYTALIHWRANIPMPSLTWAERGRRLRHSKHKLNQALPFTAIGMIGMFAGPKFFIIDRVGLADPILARLPMQNSKRWRIGHLYRKLPAGYIE
jgi:arabinofuranosyltransferase